jgi:environmental stress-induced protein Ves
MSWHRTALQDVAPSPWRNGGGMTHELVVFPVREQWHWRMSIAAIERNGPFSRFEGVQRWIAVLQGGGVRLSVGGASHTLTTESEPLAFDGAGEALCEPLGGGTLDFNLMVREGRGHMRRVRGDAALAVASGSAIALWSGDAAARATFEGQTIEVPPRCLAWRHLDLGGRVEVSVPNGLWMEVAQ